MSERERDAELGRRVAEAFAPEPLDEAARARFDARLAERIARERSHPLGGWLAPLASAAAVMALGWWGFTGGVTPPLPIEEPVRWELSRWEWDLLLGGELAAEREPVDALPAEYIAIAGTFLAP